ncbi:MAG TPA: DUF5123 domain-containing protein [Candidatus Marinimicrobia bacterium]|nr:DUF5123 domain-containing protein [Candidatus Neomarinimicrobiota bacterium]
MKKMLLCMSVLFMTGNLLYSQIFVPPGDGTLHQALAGAEDGDVFQLAAGQTYTESGYTEFGDIVEMDVTIEVDGDGSEKAIVKMETEREGDETITFFNVGDQASLTLRGIEFDGALNELPSANYLVTFTMGDVPTPILVKKITVENCYIHNLVDDVIAAGNGDMKYNVVVDSTIVDNVIITNTCTSIYYKYAGANYISLTNSTIHNINSYGLRIAGPVETGLPDNTPVVVIDHTTWYKTGVGDDAREMIQGEKGPLLNPWMVTNSIFVDQVNKDRTFINIKDNPGPGEENDYLSTIASICFWDIGQVNFRSHTVMDTLRMDPGFADPDNGDFTLPEHSPLFSLGTDGGPIGDPRWYIGVYGIKDDVPVVRSFALHQNYPNPFNPVTQISFDLEKAGWTTLAVYDLMGRERAVIVSENLHPGHYKYSFDASGLSSGVYFYQLGTAGQTLTRKMMYLE